MSNKIEVISSCLVPLATNVVSVSKMDLTAWDLQYIPHDPIQKGIFFHNPQSQELQKNLINHLKNSLSCTLDFFPPLTGRLSAIANDDHTTWYFINCNNAGVEFTHAVARGLSLSDFLEPKYIPEIVSSLFLLNGVPNYKGVSNPLLGVQITELVDGLFIACTMNHVVGDGTSFWHFMNSWAEISRGLHKVSRSPVFERWFPIKDNRIIHLPPPEQMLSKHFVPPPLLERFFHFSKESVAKLKAKANFEAGNEKISSLQAVSAHLWRSVVRSRCGRKSIHDFHLLVGARARVPLADGYFGNAAHVAETAVHETEILQNGLGYTAMKINELVNQQTGEAVIKFVEDWMKNPKILGKGGISFIVSSSPRHNVYASDFGWGKPIAVRSGKGQKTDGKMTFFPAAMAGGIDVEVCLAPETLRAMEADAEFMEAVAI